MISKSRITELAFACAKASFFVFFFTIILFSVADAEVFNCQGIWTDQPCDAVKASADRKKNSKSKQLDGSQSIAINPMVELDFKSAKEVFEIRQAAVAKNFDLVSKQYFETANKRQNAQAPSWKNLLNKFFAPQEQVSPVYVPHPNIFGQIVSGKPWWGILGIGYYGPGARGIDGVSEESRMIVNPYLLVGLVESSAHIVNTKEFSPKEIYPKPVSLVWQANKNTATAVYDVSYYVQTGKKYNYSDNKIVLNLVAYNACDFGYNYLYLEPSDSRNIKTHGARNQAVRLLQFIHLGNSCGYPGGCNNMSPHIDGLEIDVSSLPAKAHLKLWKNNPLNNFNTADFDFILELK
jgi:hypothetical protein